jgi:hypothetical protein
VTARTVKPTVQRPDTILDVLQTPLIGRLLRSRRGRLVMQIPLLLVALLVIYDGFTGDQIASRNIAGALPRPTVEQGRTALAPSPA